MSLDRLGEMCRQVGRLVPFWTQGPGGNLSWKDGQTLWIKASGLRLDEVSPERGLAAVDLENLRRTLQGLAPQDELLYSQAIIDWATAGGRPSMETGFHALLPKKFVWHFHSLLAVLMAWKARDQEVKAWLERESAGLMVLPGIRPGWQLSQAVGQNPDCPVFLLENHGVVLQSDDASFLQEWLSMEGAFAHHCGYQALFELMNSPCPLQVALSHYRNPAPMRIYFPDTAVFSERLAGILQSAASGDGGEFLFEFTPRAWLDEPGVAEIWLATQALYQVCPELCELPGEVSSQVAGLPTEVFRRQA